MAKKRKKTAGEQATSVLANALVDATAGDAAAGGVGGQCGERDLRLALRAVAHAAAVGAHGGAAAGSEANAGAGEVLAEALQPLIMARAAKYEDDAQAAKLAGSAAGRKKADIKVSPATMTSIKRPLPAAAPIGGAADAGLDAAPLRGEEVEEAVRSLRSIAAKPDLLQDKAFKPLRAALHPLVEEHIRESKASPAFRVTSMLSQRHRWDDAQTVLTELRALPLARRPKLGAYQRWVRELNVSEGDARELAMLDSIMRVAAGFPTPAPGSRIVEGSLSRVPPFEAVPPSSTAAPAASLTEGEVLAPESAVEAKHEEDKSVANKLSALIQARKAENSQKKMAATAALGPEKFKVVAHEEAHARKPPNRFDLDIYMARDPITLSLRSPPATPVVRHCVSGVEGAMVLSSVLSTAECDEIRIASELLGYRPDVPLSSSLDERAHNVVLMATEAQNDALFERIRQALPATLGGDTLFGINRRWRLYRYQAGNLYRKHLDGAWPASGLRDQPGGGTEYVYDAYGGNTRSRLTFIIYLNDDFEGGETTFYVPQPGVEGTLEGRPVKPCMGCATVFPHGDTGVPLLHEGSAVKQGTKYLLRTDVVYAAREASASEKEAARLRGVARRLGMTEAPKAWAPAPTRAEEVMAKAKRKKKKPMVKNGTLKEGSKGADRKTGAKDGKRIKKNKRNAGGGKRAKMGTKGNDGS